MKWYNKTKELKSHYRIILDENYIRLEFTLYGTKKIKKELDDDYLVVYINFSKAECYQKRNMSVVGLLEFFFKEFLIEAKNKNLNTLDKKIEKYFKVNDFKIKAGGLTAEKIYHYLKSVDFDKKESAEIRGYFYADNHEIWYMTDEEKAAAYGIGQPSDEQGDGEGQPTVSMTAVALNATWQQIAERMQVDIETFGLGIESILTKTRY